MKTPHRLQVKLFFVDPQAVPPSDFVPVFHRWIQRGSIDQLLIDVHNYSHVHEGTGILLVGHEGDFAIDGASGRTGLLYTLKRGDHYTFAAAVRVALRRVALGATLLQQERALRDRIAFDLAHFELMIPDRLTYPNRVDVFEAIKEELSSVILQASGVANVSLERIDNDAREPLAIRATMPEPLPLSDLATATVAEGIG
ncbi:MAG TPA: hypothetical protein VF190_13310 [Rhodothermales bacterium]